MVCDPAVMRNKAVFQHPQTTFRTPQTPAPMRSAPNMEPNMLSPFAMHALRSNSEDQPRARATIQAGSLPIANPATAPTAKHAKEAVQWPI
jgi:hypothetical protein